MTRPIRASKDGDKWFDDDSSSGSVAVERVKPALKRPRMYKVVMLNDDYTPMDFVVHVLEAFFSMHREQATHVMLKVHTEGSAVCGVYTRDIAETRAEQVNSYARQNEHPLMCNIEVSEYSEGDDEVGPG